MNEHNEQIHTVVHSLNIMYKMYIQKVGSVEKLHYILWKNSIIFCATPFIIEGSE